MAKGVGGLEWQDSRDQRYEVVQRSPNLNGKQANHEQG